MTIVEFADREAEKDHRGQKRWSGEDYIIHPRAVSKIARERALKEWLDSGETPLVRDLDLIEVLGLSHDRAEDCGVTEEKIIKDFEDAGFGLNYDLHALYTSLVILNKKNYPDYCAFTLAAKADFYARYVKIGDIIHNSSNLKKGSMLDKYLLALHVLEN